MQSIHIRK